MLVLPNPQQLVLCVITSTPRFTQLNASQLERHVNFIRVVAKIPLQLFIGTLRRDPRLLSAMPVLRLLRNPWVFTSSDFHAWLKVHPRSIAADATPQCMGLADPSAALSL